MLVALASWQAHFLPPNDAVGMPFPEGGRPRMAPRLDIGVIVHTVWVKPTPPLVVFHPGFVIPQTKREDAVLCNLYLL